MTGETGQRFRKLCVQAAVEQDPNKLMELVAEINKLLWEKEQRLPKPPDVESPHDLFVAPRIADRFFVMPLTIFKTSSRHRWGAGTAAYGFRNGERSGDSSCSANG